MNFPVPCLTGTFRICFQSLTSLGPLGRLDSDQGHPQEHGGTSGNQPPSTTCIFPAQEQDMDVLLQYKVINNRQSIRVRGLYFASTSYNQVKIRLHQAAKRACNTCLARENTGGETDYPDI